MRYLGYILFAFIISLTCLFFVYNFALQNVLVVILFLMIYYSGNVFVIINTVKSEKTGSIFVLALSLNYAVCCFAESYLLGLPLLFLITLIYIKKRQLGLKIIVNGVLGVLVVNFLLYITLSQSIKIQEINKIYNSDGNIAVISILVDTGATGMDYKYIVQKEYLSGLFRVEKRLEVSNYYLDVHWIDNNTCIIGDNQYNISLP
jgi:hypothetical protein